jgi:hypothetical protein
MPLKLRPTGLGSGIDYTVTTGEREVGRIYQTRGGPEHLRWSKGGENAELKGWAFRTLPHLKEHLSMAEKLK